MKSFRKVIGVPDNNLTKVDLVSDDMFASNQTGGNIETPPVAQPKGNLIRQHALDKQRKLLTVILQLAKSNSYTEDLKIRLKNGSLLEPNQFINLLNYALSPGKALAGVNDFVEVLHQAKVTPEMLINENVKLLLRNIYQKKGQVSFASNSTQTPQPVRDNFVEQPTFDPQAKAQQVQEPSTAGPNYQTKDLPEPPNEDFDDEDEQIDDEPEKTFMPTEYTPTRAQKRKGHAIVEEAGLRKSTRARLVPNRLQVGKGWEPYDSDDEI